MGKPKTPADKEEIVVSMYKSGKSATQVAHEMKMTPTTVYRCLKRASVVPHKLRRQYSGGGFFRKFSDKEESQIAVRYQGGWSRMQLAGQYGCSAPLIDRILRRHGIMARSRGTMMRVLTKAEIDEVERLYNKGRTQSYISQELGISPRHIARAVESNFTLFREDGSLCPPNPVRSAAKYVWEWIPRDHIYAEMRTYKGYVLVHRLRMAEKLGRALKKWETVHHIDGNPRNNLPENLQLRIGYHGKHVVYCCADCGSKNIKPVELEGT